jgi:hypothetical protein
VRASPRIRDSVHGFGSLDQVPILGIWVRDFDRGRRRHFEVDVITRTRDEICNQRQAAPTTRLLYFPFTRFICPYTLSLACSVSAFYLTSTSPTRHAPRRPRDLPRDTPPQASNDVQCHIGEGDSSNVQKIHGKCMLLHVDLVSFLTAFTAP